MSEDKKDLRISWKGVELKEFISGCWGGVVDGETVVVVAHVSLKESDERQGS